MMNVLKELSPEEFLLFKNWFKNIIVKGLDKELEDVSKIIEESEEAEVMVYNLEKTLKLKEELERRETIGKIEGKIEVARNMLRRGMEANMVAEVTELTINEVEKIIKQLNGISH